MAHDDLCVCSRKDHAHFFHLMPADVCMACQCDDIAQVRADEREKAAQRVREIALECLGRASVAWSELPSGVFDSDTCLALADEICAAARGEAS